MLKRLGYRLLMDRFALIIGYSVMAISSLFVVTAVGYWVFDFALRKIYNYNFVVRAIFNEAKKKS